MKHNNSDNAVYSQQATCYDDNDYLGYSGYEDADGCRRLFFTILALIIVIITICVTAILQIP